ncbi:hypothetical protein JOE40_000779 [Arthrobacter sp. PvP102]|uniref:hypothetical protein n=1 Tax=unclassified Arthrobacter TaxID=235627 RepID=UPI001AE4A87A|nr:MULTISPECIES: hypothetical protein [unclassified Arthrobacter]MBP1235311.1 hypothetical protein [Arthrobacter sp. PvP103]MBP1236270.1 hypothetical protein [Arthrobacter sp. PvP102]
MSTALNVWVPQQIEGVGGSEAAAATVGITDTAMDHADKRADGDACATMPPSVRSRLETEALNPPAPPPD